VPVSADSAGLHPAFVGDLPAQLAAINRTNVNVQELAVTGFLRQDGGAVLQAVALDPPAAASISLEAMESMADELFDAHARRVEGYAWRLPSTRARNGRPQAPSAPTRAGDETRAKEVRGRESSSV
jgi:hypothetical protein